MKTRGKISRAILATAGLLLLMQHGARAHPTKSPMALCNILSVTRNAGVSKEQDMYSPYGLSGITNFNGDYPQGIGSPPAISKIEIVRDYPFPNESVIVQAEAVSLRDASDGLPNAAMNLLWGEVALSVNNGISWYANDGVAGRGIPMDYFTRETLSVLNVGNNKWKTYVGQTLNWAVSPTSFAYTGGEPAPNRRGTGSYSEHPYDYPCPYGNNCPLIDTFPRNTGANFPQYPGEIKCSKGGLNCNVPGFPEGGGDLLDNFPSIDPIPGTAFPSIPGEPVVRVNGVPGISCDIYNGATSTLHPLCDAHPDEDLVATYDAYGIYGYSIVPGQGKVIFKHALKPNAIVDAVFYSSDRLTWTAKLDLTSTVFTGKNVFGGEFMFHTRFYDTCGNMATGAQAPPNPSFAPTTNEIVPYVGVEDAHSDMVQVDMDPLVQIRIDDVETQCSATDDLCPNPVPDNWDYIAKGTCGDAGCECCYNECAPTTCTFLGGRGSCAPMGDAGNAPGCGPEYGSKSGMLEIHDFKLSHDTNNLYLKVQTQGSILWGCYGSWYPIIGCEVFSFSTQASKFNGYGFQITNNYTKGAFYLVIVPEIPIYGNLTIFLDVEALKSGALGKVYDGRELDQYAAGGGCKKPGSDPPAADPCEELGCTPSADPGGDCDNDSYVNNVDSCPCEKAGTSTSDGCPDPAPPSEETKMSCESCQVEVSGNKMYVQITKDGQIGFVADDSYQAMAMLLSIHDLSVDNLLYKACLNTYNLGALATDTSPRMTYYESGSRGRFNVQVRIDLVPPIAPQIKACLGRCDEPVTDNLKDDDGDLATLEPDPTYTIDEGYDPTATMIELKFKEVMFNVDAYKSLLTDLAGYKIYVNRGAGTAWQHFYTICDSAASVDCDGNSPTAPDGATYITRSDRTLDEPYAPNGTRFPKPIDDTAALTGFGFPGEPVSCIIEDDCDLPGNGIDDDKDGLVDEGCNTSNCKYDNNPTLKLAEDGQTYTFKANAYDVNGNYSIFSNEVTLTILRNTTAPAKPVLSNVYSIPQGRSLKVVWALNPETDMGGYALYRCPARPIDAVKKTEDGTLAAYCADEANFRQVNKDIMVPQKNHLLDEGLGFYEGGIGPTNTLCAAGLVGDDDCDWNAATDDLGADGAAGTSDAGEGDGLPTPGEPNAYEWIDCSDVSATNANLLLCGNMDPAWATGTALFNTAGQRVNLYTAADTTRPVLIHNGLVDGYTYYYKIKAIDRPYAGDGLEVPGTCDKGLNSWQRATKEGCVNPIEDVDGQAPLLSGRNCDDPLVKFNWSKGGNCSVYSDALSGVPVDTLPPSIPIGLKTSGSADGTTASLVWTMLGTDVTLDHYRVYLANQETGPYACWHGGCDTPPYTDGCKCTDTAQCYSGRTCDKPLKICTDPPNFTIKAQSSGCGTAPFNDGCVCTSDSDCLQDTCSSGKCSISKTSCTTDADCANSRTCSYPYAVCLPTGSTMTAADGIDNDGDGMIDEEIPDDGIDNDIDGLVDEDTGRQETITNSDGTTTYLTWIGRCPAPDKDICYDGFCKITAGACTADSDCAPVKYAKFTSTMATITGLSTNRTYFVKAAGVDNAVYDDTTDGTTPPNEGTPPAGVPVIPRDLQPPANPTGDCVDAVTGKMEPCVEIDTSISPRDDYGGRLTIFWTRNAEDDVQGYNLYRAAVAHGAGEPSMSQYRIVNGPLIPQPTSGTSVYYKDSELTNGMDYYYLVSAVDNRFNQSGYSEVGGPGTPADTVPPGPPVWNPLYRIKNIGCDTADRPSNCNTEVAIDCNTGGLTAEGTGDTVIIKWAAHPQAVCLYNGPTEGDWRSYNIYRSDTPDCEVTSNTACNPGLKCKVASGLTYPFYKQTTKVVAGTTYYYCMTSLDSSGNESAVSEIRQITPADVVPPEPPTGLTATPLVNSTIGLGWFKSDETDIAGYKIYRSMTGLEGSYAEITYTAGPTVITIDPDGVTSSGDEKTIVNALSYVDNSSLITEQLYYYKITAVDAQGNESLKSDAASAKTTVVDTTPPDRPENIQTRNGFNTGELTAVRTNGADDDSDGFIDDGDLQGRRVEIHWDRVTNQDVVKYRIYRLDPPTIAACTCDAVADPNGDCDNDLSPNVIDDCACTPQNKTTDQFRQGYTYVAEQELSAACPSSNHVRPVGKLSANSCYYVDTNAPSGLCYVDQYWYQITAVDSTGNETPLDSAYAYPGTPVPRASQPPEKPEKPKIVVVAGGNSLIVKFHQNNSSTASNKAIIGYYIYRDVKSTGSFNYKVADINDLKKLNHCDTVDPTYACITDLSVINGQRYFYKVQAYDAYGNVSEMSDPNFGTPATTEPPKDATYISVQPDSTSSYTLRVIWAPGSALSNPAVLGFKLLRSSVSTGVWNIITPPKPTPEGFFPKTASIYMDNNLTMGSTYCYRVITVDSLGGESTGIDACGVPGSDIFAPMPPVGLTVVASPSTVSLSWSNNSEPDIAGYNAYYGTSKTTVVNRINPTMLTYPYTTLGGLTNGTLYWFGITAVDKAGNESATSTLVAGMPSLTASNRANVSRNSARGWNLISIPAAAGGGTTTLSRQSGAPLSGENAFMIQPGEKTYNEVPLDSPIAAGPGSLLWYYVTDNTEPLNIDTPVYGGDEITVDLSDGWNLVGNPFTTSMPWDDYHVLFSINGADFVSLGEAVSNGTLKFAAAFSNDTLGNVSYTKLNNDGSETMDAGTGFWVKVNGSVKIRLIK